MKRRAMIDRDRLVVTNVIAWDGVSPFLDAPGCISVECDKYIQKGDSYDIESAIFTKRQVDAPKPPPPTADELAAEKFDATDRLVARCLFTIENRVRALEGKDAITPEQFKAALVNMWKEMNNASGGV